MQFPTVKCNTEQAVTLWNELMLAYIGKNGFGGDTAEIYIHSMMAHSSIFAHNYGSYLCRPSVIQANLDIRNIARTFARHYNVMIQLQEGQLAKMGTGKENSNNIYFHRVHLKVVHHKSKEKK